MAQVNAELTITLNLGNYQSIKVTAGLTDTVREYETPSEAYDRVYKIVEDELAMRVATAKEMLGG